MLAVAVYHADGKSMELLESSLPRHTSQAVSGSRPHRSYVFVSLNWRVVASAVLHTTTSGLQVAVFAPQSVPVLTYLYKVHVCIILQLHDRNIHSRMKLKVVKVKLSLCFLF